MIHPDKALNCLLIQTKFSEYSYWNFKSACETLGAKTPTPPLGLLTVAALLPSQWSCKLLDLNTHDFSEEEWAKADVICIGGMLPQQSEMLRFIKKANVDGKYVVVGGPDPSSQPETYKDADALVLGEGEVSIPRWLMSWAEGEPKGTFHYDEKPSVEISPVPRFDLIDTYDYQNIGIQYSRGCPFNCEFCDIIELYGRTPRCKTSDQIVAELEAVYATGYRGQVDLVDDNFIGNKKKVKEELLPALIEWSNIKSYPFYFSTEASINIADDRKLLRQMRAADFRYLFIGIETPDPDVLKATQKPHNAKKLIKDRIDIIYEFGMMVAGGFIMGFDGEKRGIDKQLINCIEETGICVAMVGLLVALPCTQLTRRLAKEDRLFDFSMQKGSAATADECLFEFIDQTISGLNFKTERSRVEILEEFENVVSSIYEPKAYMDRILRTVAKLNLRPKPLAKSREKLRLLRALVRTCIIMTKRPTVRRYFWRNFFRLIFMGPFKFEVAMTFMSGYMHYQTQTEFLVKSLKQQQKFARESAEV